MPFGTQYSQIFFAETLAMIPLKILSELDIRIFICVEDLLTQYYNKEKLLEQTQILMIVLETFNRTIVQEKCETEPKQYINFLQ
ncbi:MAG: hypothetical protein EZS28_000551 [Streblomastix strix]|uniref:Reverse transcriptase domain-containing protein n=1 Tax=Streblomastix strix TaxID=222440 RepID=A0A5J4X9W6_9EUKA|nr:MAG: hypothetical protein EZS28_000551 [Streblomastix strix]